MASFSGWLAMFEIGWLRGDGCMVGLWLCGCDVALLADSSYVIVWALGWKWMDAVVQRWLTWLPAGCGLLIGEKMGSCQLIICGWLLDVRYLAGWLFGCLARWLPGSKDAGCGCPAWCMAAELRGWLVRWWLAGCAAGCWLCGCAAMKLTSWVVG